MKLSSIFILVSSITLLPLIYCSSDPHNNHDNTWMAFLPSRLEHFLKSRTSTIGVSDEDISSSNQERRTTPETTEITTQNSTTPEIASGSTYNSNSNSGASIGGSIGGIIIFILICYCCFRCCCSNREVVSQGVVVHQQMPQPTNLPNIVIQHVNAGPASPPQQQPIVQHIHNAPPQVVHHVHQPPYPTQQNYPPGYEATPQQMLQQEWSPHAPMNQQQAPPQHNPYNPSAPPNYGKY